MLPTLVLVGRPNVGKSTLFNRLTASRAALVADFPGLTRDRHYGRGRGGDRPYLVVDTGGFVRRASSYVPGGTVVGAGRIWRSISAADAESNSLNNIAARTRTAQSLSASAVLSTGVAAG